MTKREVLEIILSERVVAIIRLKSTREVPDVVAALVEGGIKALEITTNTPEFLKHITQARRTHLNTLTGAGTVLTSDQARAAIDSGAQFLVTPNTNPDVIDVASTAGIPVLMGAYTPTEISKASQYGADIVKLFPASIAGIPYLKSVMAPLEGIKVFAVGGINTDNAESWLKSGAAGVGIGSQLVTKKADGMMDSVETTNNAKRLTALIKSL